MTRKPKPKIAAGEKPQPPARPPRSSDSKADLELFFQSPYCEDLKRQICDIGRRLWQRAYVDGNGGNIAIRVGKDIALCTPTLVSKGFMKPEDLCLVDFKGNQLFGAKRRTSEILMHLQIMQRQPRAVATVHCHAPYGTGFALADLGPLAKSVGVDQTAFQSCLDSGKFTSLVTASLIVIFGLASSGLLAILFLFITLNRRTARIRRSLQKFLFTWRGRKSS